MLCLDPEMCWQCYFFSADRLLLVTNFTKKKKMFFWFIKPTFINFARTYLVIFQLENTNIFNKTICVNFALATNCYSKCFCESEQVSVKMTELYSLSLIYSFQESSKNQDDEHCLIARYASRLAADGAAAVRRPIRTLAQRNIPLLNINDIKTVA